MGLFDVVVLSLLLLLFVMGVSTVYRDWRIRRAYEEHLRRFREKCGEPWEDD